jgi:AcrR family transcriptional regulator
VHKPTRHEQRKTATRQSLLEAARELIIEKDYLNVDILDITERANVSKATFYQHFPNKEECVRQLMLQGFDALVEEIFSSGQTAESRQEWLSQSFRRVFHWAEEHRAFLLIMVGGAASTQLNQFGRNYMVEISKRFIGEFGLTDLGIYPVEIKAQVITGILVQLLGWWLENDTGYTADQIADLAYNIMGRGLGGLDV